MKVRKVFMQVLGATMVAVGFVLTGMASLCTLALTLITPNQGSNVIMGLSAAGVGLALLLGGLFLLTRRPRD